jgi:hypothetical protein
MSRPLAASLLCAGSLLCLALTACTGYQLGGSKPSHLAGVHAIHLATVKNDTLFPRAAARASSAIAEALVQDGTYRLSTADHADARLQTTLSTIDYGQVRSSRRDSLRSEELEMTVHFHWTLVAADNPLQILEKGHSTGTTRFLVDPNLQTARQTALPDALKRAAESMVGRLADSF